MSILNNLVPIDFRRVIDVPLRRYYLCITLATMGSGLTLSLFVVYLHNVLHFSVTFSTLLLTFTAIVGLGASPLSGTLVDRIGPIPVIVGSFVIEAAALVLWAFARRVPEVVVAALALTVFGGSTWGPGSTLLGRLVPEEHRLRAFAVNFLLVNLGLGLGGLVSASIVDLHHPVTFRVLYVLNAGMNLAIAVLFATLWRHGRANRDGHEISEEARSEGWREVLADRRLVHYVLASLVLMLGGYASQEAGFSLFVVNQLHLSVHVIGIMFFCNTSTIVAAQLVVVNRVEGRSRTRVMALGGVLWFVFWILLFASLRMPAVLAVFVVCLGMAVFALGETVMGPTGSALVNQISPDHLRGRYNATSGLVWGVTSTLAPAITAFFFAEQWGDAWPLFIAGCAAVGSLSMLSLRHRLTASEDGRGA